jgi:hypothetical protein
VELPAHSDSLEYVNLPVQVANIHPTVTAAAAATILSSQPKTDIDTHQLEAAVPQPKATVPQSEAAAPGPIIQVDTSLQPSISTPCFLTPTISRY